MGHKGLSMAEPNRAANSQAEVADLLVAYLEQIGVEYVFGVPGGAIEPLFNALARSQRRGGPRPVVARHETGAAFMAEGYARESGRLGVCCATSGPGATNLLTGVACAHENGVPLLAITGQPALPSFGRRALQESACTGVNTLGMFRHCTHYNSLVSHPDQVENKVVSAIMRTRQTPEGAAHLSFPVDILRSPAKSAAPNYSLASLMRKSSLLDEHAVSMLVQELQQARQPLFLLGGGCFDAMDMILELADLTGAQFICNPDAKGLVNPRHTAFRGVFGFAGHDRALQALKAGPDLMVAIGTSLGEWTSGAWSELLLNERLVHVAANEDHFARSPMARLHVRGSISTICRHLLQTFRELPPRAVKEVPGVPGEYHAEAMLAERDKYLSDATPIKPQRVMRELSLRFPPTTRFVADAGNSTAWAVHYLLPRDRRLARHAPLDDPDPQHADKRTWRAGWLRVVMDFAPMGWAIGTAIGIARAHPSCPVVCITGDGSYLMSGQEITVAVQERLPVVFAILNDSALGMVKHGQRLAGAEAIGFELPAIDYRRLAESLGAAGFVIESPEDFERLDMDAVLRRPGPTLLDIRIDGNEVPPMNLRMKTLGTKK